MIQTRLVWLAVISGSGSAYVSRGPRALCAPGLGRRQQQQQQQHRRVGRGSWDGEDDFEDTGPAINEDELAARLIKLYDDNVKWRNRMENGDDDDDDDDDLQPAWGSPGTMEEELSLRIAQLPLKDRRELEERRIDDVFEKADRSIEEWVKVKREERLVESKMFSLETDVLNVEELLEFDASMDAIMKEAGYDPVRLERRDELAEEEEAWLAGKATALRAKKAARAPAALARPIEPIVLLGGEVALSEAVRAALGSLGLRDVRLGCDEDGAACNSLVLLDQEPTAGAAMIARLSPAVVVVASRHGVTRTGEFNFQMRNFKGALTRARETENAAKRATTKLNSAASFCVARFGDVSASAPGSAALVIGDAFDAAVSLEVKAQALARCVSSKSARNSTATFAGGASCSETEWTDLFVKLDGPELARLNAREGAADDEDARLAQLKVWLRNWAELWLRPDAKLTTPVQLEPSEAGVTLSFLERKAPGGSSEPTRRSAKAQGGIELRAELSPVDRRPRVRAVRTTYAEGLAVKDNSETAIVKRLEYDFTKEWA